MVWYAFAPRPEYRAYIFTLGDVKNKYYLTSSKEYCVTNIPFARYSFQSFRAIFILGDIAFQGLGTS